MPFVNLYRSGWYHRAGKPNTYDAHPGDLYPTEEAAKADISVEARDLYLGTFPVVIDGRIIAPMQMSYGVKLNGPDSIPLPLSETRNDIRQQRMAVPKTEVMREGWNAGNAKPGDFSEDIAALSTEGVGLAKAYKPTHGGYPG